MIFMRESKDGVLISVHAQPGASRSAIKGLHGDALKVAVKAPPVDGAANEAIRELLAEVFCIPVSRIKLKTGTTGRKKVFVIHAWSLADASKVLAGLLK